MESLSNKKKFYESTWFCILMLILVSPIGVVLMWKNNIFNKLVRIGLSIVAIPITAIGLIFWIAMASPKSAIQESNKQVQARNEQAKTDEKETSDIQSQKVEVKEKQEDKKQETNAEDKKEKQSNELATYGLYKNFMESERMYIEDVLRNPDKFSGKSIFYYGEVTQVIDSDDNKSCFIIIKDELSNKRAGLLYERNGKQRFLEGDSIFAVGTFNNLKSVDLLSGVNETIPVINIKNIDIFYKSLRVIVAYKSINDKNIKLYSTEKQIETEKGRVGTIFRIENPPKSCKSNYVCSDGSYVYWYDNESGKLGESYYFAPQAWD